MNSILNNSLRRPGPGGFSVVELLVVIAAISTVCGIGLAVVQRTREASHLGKLEADVSTINQSVKVYLGNGGVLEDSATPVDVLTRLKTKVAAADASAIVGHTGPFLDPRITGVVASKKGIPRAVWDRSRKQFNLDTDGQGFSEFVLDDTLGARPAEVEGRQTIAKFAKKDSWVWDYEAEATAAAPVIPRDADLGPGSPVVFSPNRPGTPGRLQPPSFSVAGGLYDYLKFPMPVQLVNPNPNGSSVILYSLNKGAWGLYHPGSLITLPQNQLNTTIEAYAAPIDSEQWVDSSSATNLYRTIFFKGSSSGLFHTPKGDPRLVTNLVNKLKLPHFEWGAAVPGQPGANTLDFTGVSSFFVVPDQEFKIGDLSYSNSTTYASTNATSVEIELALNLTEPKSVELLNFGLRLLSTPNTGRNADTDADYVWIPTLASKFSTTVQGLTFYLQLRFGQSNANSFTTIDEFHVHENKKATGAVYGKLTTKPTFLKSGETSPAYFTPSRT